MWYGRRDKRDSNKCVRYCAACIYRSRRCFRLSLLCVSHLENFMFYTEPSGEWKLVTVFRSCTKCTLHIASNRIGSLFLFHSLDIDDNGDDKLRHYDINIHAQKHERDEWIWFTFLSFTLVCSFVLFSCLFFNIIEFVFIFLLVSVYIDYFECLAFFPYFSFQFAHVWLFGNLLFVLTTKYSITTVFFVYTVHVQMKNSSLRCFSYVRAIVVKSISFSFTFKCRSYYRCPALPADFVVVLLFQNCPNFYSKIVSVMPLKMHYKKLSTPQTYCFTTNGIPDTIIYHRKLLHTQFDMSPSCC